MKSPSRRITSMVLIDCDPSFRDQMQQFADSRGLKIQCFESVLAMGTFGNFCAFDIAIIESESPDLSGQEIALHLASFLSELPLLLISDGQTPNQDLRANWPSTIKDFIHKSSGPDAILDLALAIA